MNSQPNDISENEYKIFVDLFEFWGRQYADHGLTIPWSGISPVPPVGASSFEIRARAAGGDPELSFRREAGRVREYWIERGALESRGEFGCFMDAMKALAVTLASQYRADMGYEPLYTRLQGKIPDGVEMSVVDGREVYRLSEGGPDRYIPICGTKGGVLPYLLTRSLSDINTDLLTP